MDENTIAFAGRVFQEVRAGNPVIVELLARGMPADLRNGKGDSLLMLAAYHGHAELVQALMAHGADAELANDRGQLPLSGAAFKGYLEVVRAMVEAGANVDGFGPDGRTALMTAAMFNHIEIVEFLLASGADVGHRDIQGTDAEAAARAMGAQAAVERLERARNTMQGTI